jgi:serine O-acetyltransferase
MNAITLHRFGHIFCRHRFPLIPKIVEATIFILYNSFVPSSARIGKRTVLAYKGIGVVIHKDSVIGNDCIIGPQVTIGGKSGDRRPPVIGNNVYIASGAKIIGDIHIGDNCVIGVNAVVNKSFPANTVLAGIPAKQIGDNSDGSKGYIKII